MNHRGTPNLKTNGDTEGGVPITDEVKMRVLEQTGIRPGTHGTCLCPICEDSLLHWSISGFKGAVKAFCNRRSCVHWDEEGCEGGKFHIGL